MTDWQRIDDNYYAKDKVGGLIRDGSGLWWWFPYNLDYERQGPYRDLTSAKHSASRSKINQANITTIWKDGTYKTWSVTDAHYAAQDPDWLVNID